ncbi:MAG TPA: ABC transporter ATP-binding protein [Thermomicrobiales bacterium]|nr:ABC transporter ATP-binding protein [Thermomicrobiales bacterium]
MTTTDMTQNGHQADQAHTEPFVYELERVSKIYGSGNSRVVAIEDIDLTIRPGEFVAVVGASGSGKTTLLQLLGALDRPTSGSITCLGRPLGDMSERELTLLRRRSIGFVFQQFNLIPTLTASQNVEAKLAVASDGASEQVVELLAAVGLKGRANHLPSQLSGGEQQRVAIARALSTNPSVLLADEPTGNLDTTTGQEILQLLRALSNEHAQTVILITHDRELAASAPRMIELRDGRIISDERNRLEGERQEVAP